MGAPAGAAVLDTRVQIVAIVVSALLLGLVLELVRRRRLAERYALLWMLVSIVLLVLAVWSDLLREAARLVGIVPANFLLFAAIGFSFFLLLHFSVAISRLAEHVKTLAIENARLDLEAREARAAARRATNGEADRLGKLSGAHEAAPEPATSRRREAD